MKSFIQKNIGANQYTHSYVIVYCKCWIAFDYVFVIGQGLCCTLEMNTNVLCCYAQRKRVCLEYKQIFTG